MKEDIGITACALLVSSSALDPLEDGVRQRARHFIEAILEGELRAALSRGRYERSGAGAAVIATATARGRSSARSAPRRLGCRGRVWSTRPAGRRSGGRRRCAATSG